MKSISSSSNKDKLDAVTINIDDPYAGMIENAILGSKLVLYSSEDLLQSYCSVENADRVVTVTQENGSWLPTIWIAVAIMSFAGMLLNQFGWILCAPNIINLPILPL